MMCFSLDSCGAVSLDCNSVIRWAAYIYIYNYKFVTCYFIFIGYVMDTYYLKICSLYCPFWTCYSHRRVIYKFSM